MNFFSLQNTLTALAMSVLSPFVFSQGGVTPDAADNSPSVLPFTVTGTTAGAGNDFELDPTIDGGNDYFYYFCAPADGVVYATLLFNGSANPAIYPSLQVYEDVDLLFAAPTASGTTCLATADPNTANTANTIGFPILVTAGQCYYVQVDNGIYFTDSYNFTLSLSYNTSTPVTTLQPGCTNMGFDNGTTSGWVGSWGHSVIDGLPGDATPNYTPVFTTLNAGHHQITSGGTDPYTGAVFQVCPLIPGNTNSIRLGDGPNASFGGAQIIQNYSVTASNALLTYYYAAIMQDAGTDHLNYEQPFFQIETIDCNGNSIVCGDYLVTGGPSIPGFVQIGTSNVYYKDWTPVSIDLTPYIGSCITIKFTVGDCAAGAHFAYAYLDATCGPVEIVTPPSICQFSSATLTAPTGGASYSWVDNANPTVIIGTSNTLVITPTTVGPASYSCVITSVTGCNSFLTANLNVLASPQLSVTNPAPVCSPATVDITSPAVLNYAPGSGTLSYFMNPACTVPLSNPGAVTASGVYYVRLTNAGGCSDLQPVNVTVNPAPQVSVITPDQTICPNEELILSATVTPAGATNVPMSFSNVDDYAIPDGTGIAVASPITVSGITPQTNGVLPIVSVCVNIAHSWDQDLDLVLQCPDGTQMVLASAVGADGDNFSNTCFVPSGSPIASGTAPFSGSFTPASPFSSLNSCTINGTWTLLVSDFATGDAGSILDWTITFNDYMPAPTFGWTPTTAMTNSGTLQPTVSPEVLTTYIISATSSEGCAASDQVTITIDGAGCIVPVPDTLIFYVPNVFTPDGDEFNNIFAPIFTSGFDAQDYTLLIFDRWGEIIFESHDWNFGWDGTYHNVLCKEGVYTWKILVKEKVRDKHHEFHGHVTLLK